MALDDFVSPNHRDYSHNTATTLTSDMEVPSAEKAYIVGCMHGDVSLYETTDGRKIISLGTIDKEFAEEFGKMFCAWTGLNWSGFGSDSTEVTTTTYNPKGVNNSRVYEVKKGVAPLYSELHSFKECDWEHTVNYFSDFKRELLRGLWDSEGHVDKSARVEFVNTDPRTVKMYRYLTEQVLGIRRGESGYSMKKDSQGDETIVRVPGRYLKKFMTQVNPTIERKKARMNSLLNNNAVTTETN